jgi:hypothetical protein
MFFYAISPDRQRLAAVSFPNDAGYDGAVLIIDLPAWKAQRFELELSGWVTTMVFSPDGKRLAIVHGESNYKLTMVDVEQGMITARSQTDSFISRLKFTSNGGALMLYSPSPAMSPDGVGAAPPQVSLLNATDLSPRWSTELGSVRDGIYPTDETVTARTIYEPGNGFYLSPGLVFAPKQDLLYIVHADADQLTTVDFSTRKVRTVEIQAQLSWFERLLSLTAGTAHAKIADGTSKQAFLSPDGQSLYVIGVDNASSQDSSGNWEFASTSLGLEVIQASNGMRVERVETDATDLSLSPDGRFLYLRNWGNAQDNVPWTEVFDIKSGRPVTRKTGIVGTPALLMNGEYLLVSTYSTSETSHQMRILTPDGTSLLAEWTAPQFVSWMTTP